MAPTDKMGMDSAANTNSGTSRPQDRRRAARQKFVTKALLYRDNRSKSPQRITLKDVSMMGAGFETHAPVEPGTRCRIRIEAGPNIISWRVRVVCCGKIDADLFHVGTQFVTADLPTIEAAAEDLDPLQTPEMMILE